MSEGWFIATIIASVIALDSVIIFFWRRHNRGTRLSVPPSRQDLHKQAKMLLTTGFSIPKSFFARAWNNAQFRRRAGIALELVLLAVWALWLCRPYLNLDQTIIPAGGEFSSAIQTHHLWTSIKECGGCAFWNGTTRGGYPAFADVHGSMLHPLVIATTLLLGVVNGAKFAIAIAFWLAGLAQWWLARELKVGWLPRMWSAAMAIAGGHLSSRMELGAFGVILSTVMASLLIAAVIMVFRKSDWRSTVVLGIVTACTITSGQGYMQVGLVFTLPATLFLFINEPSVFLKTWKKYALGFGLGCLLAAPLVIPFLHFAPSFYKVIDPNFGSAQPLQYIPLNLIIGDRGYYYSELLQKVPYPHQTGHYIGWIPVLLAIIGLMHIRRENRHYIYFLLAGILLTFLTASATSLKWVAKIIPEIAGVRHPTQIAGLVIPYLLGLAAIGLDKLLKHPWPRLWLETDQNNTSKNIRISLSWLLLVPLFISLQSGYQFSRLWMYSVHQSAGLYQLLNNLRTESLEWVAPPFGEHAYIEPAVGMGLKLSPGILTWGWKDRYFPTAILEANRGGPPLGSVTQINTIDGIPIYRQENEPPYAAVFARGIFYPCKATGKGAHITVSCNSPENGLLVIKENMWTGWKAWQDGRSIPLTGEQWLEVNAPAGSHNFEFRYRPWDVPLGLGISLSGIIFSVWLWHHQNHSRSKKDT